MANKKVGELLSIERPPHTWADYRARILFYSDNPYHSNYITSRDFCGYTKREIIDKLRANGIICPRSIANC